MRRSTNQWFSILIPQLSPLPRTLQSLLSPVSPPSPQPTPQHPIGLCLQNKQPPSPSPLPLTPCSHIPLSRAAAVHKYINLVSACTCVRTWRRRAGVSTHRRPVGNPAGRPSIVSHHRRSAFTHQTHPARPCSSVLRASPSKQADKSPGG